MIAVFLRAEIDSQRWGERLRRLLARGAQSEDVLRRPNPDDPGENAYRRALLDETRGYEQRIGLFAGFPHDVEWHRAVVSRDEVLDILFINWDWWLDLSGGTRRPRDAARRIRAGEIPGADLDEHEEIARLASSSPELIAVKARAQPGLVLVEGHARLTSYAVFPDHVPDELEILVGVSETMAEWSEF